MSNEGALIWQHLHDTLHKHQSYIPHFIHKNDFYTALSDKK